MSFSRCSGPKQLISPKLITETSNKLAIVCLLTMLTTTMLSVAARPAYASSNPLPLGSVTVTGTLAPCSGGQWLAGMNCVSATVTGCPNVQDIGLTYGVLMPTSGTVNGVVVYFDGGDGTTASGEYTQYQMLQFYATQGYGVVEIAWASSWEAIFFPWPISTSPVPGNIQNAACRPATFLNYIYSNIYTPITTGTNGNPRAGMCAQGFSAGSAAIAYSMAYYGAGNYLDNVELISGPVLSDIKQGCQVPQAPPVTVCPPGQYGCKLGTDAPWTLLPTYVPNGANYVDGWTDDASCTAAGGTSAASNAQWLAQSIVDQSNITGLGATPIFSYPNTAMTGWLCSSLENQQSNCSGSAYNYNYCPNNSSSQGELFYEQVGSPAPPPHYAVYSVDNCFGPEGVPQGSVSALSKAGLVAPAQQAVEQDMAGAPGPPPLQGQCFHGPHTP